MKKSTIGMLVLGSMIFTKAFLVDSPESDSIVSRADNLQSNLAEATDMRKNNIVAGDPVAGLFASNFSTPVYNITPVEVVEVENVRMGDISEELNLIAVEGPSEEIKDDIIPMDYVSNTGYGLWKSSEEKIQSKQDRDGKMPLDRGSTISDNISKLFPRNP